MIDNSHFEHPAISEADGPSANGDPMGTPARSEKVVWKGRPSLPALARTAFHTHSFVVYFLFLIGIAAILGNTASALFLVGLGLAGLGLLFLFAWLSARSTLYILTDARLILRIGMAIETRVNIPLKHITAAHLHMRGSDVGDIALELGGERMLGYFLLWPHARPFQFNRPQPMLRAVPGAKELARLLAEQCAQYNDIEQNLTEVKDAGHPPLRPTQEAIRGAAVSAKGVRTREEGLTGATA